MRRLEPALTPTHRIATHHLQDVRTNALNGFPQPGQQAIAHAVANISGKQTSALVTIEDPLFDTNAKQIAQLALEYRVPMIGFKPQAEAGALME